MKILLITNTYPTPTGPQQGTFNRALVKALRSTHDVRVIAPIPWPQLLSRRSCESPRKNTNSKELHPVYYYPAKLAHHYHDHFYWYSIRPAIRQLEKVFMPDVVLGYWAHPDGAAAVRAARYFGKPAVVISGGSDLKLLTRRRARRRVIENVLRRADHVIVVSRDLEKQAKQLGVPTRKLDVIYRGVDRNVFNIRDQGSARDAIGIPGDAIMLLWAGRLEPVKNPAMLLHAAASWHRQWGNRLRIIIAGTGSMRAELENLCQQLGLNEVVRFEGGLAQRELALRFNAANVTVLTSRSEGVPNVLLESISCGVPFVATDVGGVSEIATAGIDHVIQESDVAGLVEAVSRRVNTSSTRDRDFLPDDVAVMAKRFALVFQRLLAQPLGQRHEQGSQYAEAQQPFFEEVSA